MNETSRGVQTTGAVDRSQPTLAALTNEPATFPSKVRQPQSLTTFGTVLIPPIAEVTEAGREPCRPHHRSPAQRARSFRGHHGRRDRTSGRWRVAAGLAEDTYQLTGRLLRQGPSSKVSLRLRHELSQRIVWSGEFILGVTDG